METFSLSIGCISVQEAAMSEIIIRKRFNLIPFIVVNFIFFFRDFSNFMHKKEVQESNPKLQIKTEILTDRSEQTITFDLTNGQTFIFKCANLKSLEILRLINTHITPLSPVEEPVDSGSSIATKQNKKIIKKK